MPKPVYLLTVQEAHKEYNSLMDQICAKYEQLNLSKFGAFGTPAFKAEACKLPNLLAHVSQLCQKLNLPPPKAHVLQALTILFSSKLQAGSLVRVWRMQLCRYLRITGLLSATLVLRIGVWLCVLPAITLVVDKSKKLNKIASLD